MIRKSKHKLQAFKKLKRNEKMWFTKNGERSHLKNCIKKLCTKFYEPMMIGNVKIVWNMSANVRTQCHGGTSFLKSPMVWKNRNRKKSWKTPPKELYKGAVYKILWAYDDWKCQKSLKHERQCAYSVSWRKVLAF